MFDNEYLFQHRWRDAPAVKPSNALVSTPPRLDEARSIIPELRASSLIGKSDSLPRLAGILDRNGPGDFAGLFEAQPLIEQLNILGRVCCPDEMMSRRNLAGATQPRWVRQ